MTECPICLEIINTDDASVITPCKHKFCYKCFITHFNNDSVYSKKCPACRTNLLTNSNIPPIPSSIALNIELERVRAEYEFNRAVEDYATLLQQQTISRLLNNDNIINLLLRR